MKRHNNINSLDGLRGIAFLFVFFSHTSENNQKLFSGTGKLGVWLFFILSSFLITNYFLSNSERAKKLSEWVNYLVRRSLRIYPLYILALIYSSLINSVPWSALKQHILLQAGIGHFWTIPVEFTYYFVLPLVVLILIFIFRYNLILTGVTYMVFLLIHQSYFPESQSIINSISFIVYAPVFVLGSIIALIHIKLSKIIIPDRIKKIMDFCALLILAGVFFTFPKIWSLVIMPVPFDIFHRKFIYYGFAWGIFILLMLHGKGYVRRFFELRLLRMIGTISFGAYLFHVFVISYVDQHFKLIGVFRLCTIFTITLFVSTILHLVIERPLSRISLMKKNTNNDCEINEKVIL